MATNVLEVAAGSVTFKFYYPDTTSTYPTQSPVSATGDKDASTRRTSSGPYHLAAASQTSYDSAMPTGSSQTGYVPGVAFSTYVLKGTNTSTAASDDGNNPTNISSTPVMKRPVTLVGIVAGFMLFVAAVIGVFICRRRRQRQRNGIILEKQSRRGAPASTSAIDIDAPSPTGTLAPGGGLTGRYGQSVDLMEVVTGGPSANGLTPSHTMSSHGTGTWQTQSSTHLLSAGSSISRSAGPPPTRQGTMSTMATRPLREEEADRASITSGGEITPFPFASAPPYTLESTPRQRPIVLDMDGHAVDRLALPPPPAYTLPGNIHARQDHVHRPTSAQSHNTLRTSIYSSEVDEDDALAVDGSSLARTLTTESSDGTMMSGWTEDGSSARHHAAIRPSGSVTWENGPFADRTSEGHGAVTTETSEASYGWGRSASHEDDEEQERFIAGPSYVASGRAQRTLTTTSSNSQDTSSPFGTQAEGSTAYTSPTSITSPHPAYLTFNADPFADPQSREVDHTKPLHPPIVRWSSRGSMRSNGTSARSFITGDDARSDVLPLGDHWH